MSTNTAFHTALRRLAEPGAAESCSAKEQPDDLQPDRLALVAGLKVRGLTHTEIASATGLAPSTVVALTQTPAFRRRLLDLLTTQNAPLDAYLRGEGINALVTLAELRDDPTTPKNVRKACADSLADRAFGKAAQVVSYRSEKDLPATDAELDEELRRLEGEFSRIKAN